MAILFSSFLLPHASCVAGFASLAYRDGRPPWRWTLVYTSTFTEHAVILRNARETTFIYCSLFCYIISNSFLLDRSNPNLFIEIPAKTVPYFLAFPPSLFSFFPLTLARLVFKTFQGEIFSLDRGICLSMCRKHTPSTHTQRYTGYVWCMKDI